MADDFDPSLLAWLKRIYETQDDEISCIECAALISRYVDSEIDTGKAAEQFPQLVAHLNQCPACWETYQVLRDLAQMEARSGLPTVEELIEQLKRDE